MGNSWNACTGFYKLIGRHFCPYRTEVQTSSYLFSGQLKGTIAITSNEYIGGDIETSTMNTMDKRALETLLERDTMFKFLK